MTHGVFANSWEKAKWKSYRFPVKYDTDRFEISRVHPFRQKDAIAISEALQPDERVVAIVLFGGSTTVRCHKNSDLDVVVRLKDVYTDTKTKNEVSEAIQNACGWNADVLWYDRLDLKSQLFQHILKGVQIL